MRRDVEVVVDPARPGDVFRVAALLAAAAPDCVPQSPRELFTHLSELVVARRAGNIVGCASLRPLGPGRLELRGVAVAPSASGAGLGRRLVESLVTRARRQGSTVACISRRPGFFERLGFRRIPLETFPPKAGRITAPDAPPRVGLELSPLDSAAVRRSAP